MATQKTQSKVRQAYRFIEEHRNEFNINATCRVLGVARADYYAWLDYPASDRAQEDDRLPKLIRRSFLASHSIYGAPRVLLDLRERGETCSKHRFARIMRENSLRTLHGNRIHHVPVVKTPLLIPHLLQRQFTVSSPTEARKTDITYVRTWQVWLYLAVVMELFSRRVVGWAAKATIQKELVLDALSMAVRLRKPRKTLIHSDQGTQYGSDAWRRFCKANHLESSISRRGNCWTSVVDASFFSSLKKERIKKRNYADRVTAVQDKADYIERFYKPVRRHSYLGEVSPDELETVNRRSRKRVH